MNTPSPKGHKSQRTMAITRAQYDGEKRLAQAVLLSAFRAYRKACIALSDTPALNPEDQAKYREDSVFGDNAQRPWGITRRHTE